MENTPVSIPQSFIQELLARVDVVDVVGRYVQLKKSGANFMGLCPFHGEKSPSFSVSPASTIKGLLPQVNIYEDSRLTGNEWVMKPSKGVYQRPVLETLSLRGYENPEIRVKSDGSHPLQGVVESTPYGAFSFDADTSGFRYRIIGGAALWDAGFICRSTGVN